MSKLLIKLKNVYQKLKINSSRSYLESFIKEAANSLPVGTLILDAGSGNCMYKPWFSNAKYESADFCQVDKFYDEITYVCDLANIPVEDNKYEMVICTQVLEHVPDPKAILKEFYRILKPTGQIFLSAPLFYEEHEIPYDYYRYTRFGFEYLFQSVGFRLKRIEWLEGYYGTLSYQLEKSASCLPLKPKYYGGGFLGFLVVLIIFPLKLIFALSSILFAHLDIRYKNTSTGYCKNYFVIAEKAVSGFE